MLIAPTDAHSDDPLSVASLEIQELNKSIKNLTYRDEFNRFIDIAEAKYDEAVLARDLRDSTEASYNAAVEAKSLATQSVNMAQSEVDGQTAVVATSLANKNSAKDTLDVANINLQTAQSSLQSASGSGLAYTVYSLVRVNNVATPGTVLCSGTWNSNSMQLPVCGNRYENFIVKFSGQITVPSYWTSTYFAGYTDDGFRMYVDGNLAVNNWVEQGVRWSAYSPVYDVSQDKTLDVEIWWYNGGGPGSYHLGWAIPGGWTGAGCDYTGGWGVGFSCDLHTFSSGSGPTQSEINSYNQALSEQQAAQVNYSNKVAAYEESVQTLTNLTQNLTIANENLTIADQNLTTSLEAKNAASNAYEQSIVDLNNAIDNAWDYYEAQLEKELQSAIAQAAANAAANQPSPQPSPEPTLEPTPQPTTEPTIKPTEQPTTEPTPETTVKPTPEPEKTVEPKPEPTKEVVTPIPTPAPSPTPKPTVEPEKPIAVPEKGTGSTEDLSGVIANLTSKDNKLIKLSPEQVAAVSQTLVALTPEAKAEVAKDLGISSNEVAKIAEQMKSNPELAEAFVQFADRAAQSGDAAMPFTLADAVTEVQTEAFLSDPLGAVFDVDVKALLSNFSELGSDMTDDQREKAQEVIIPVVIVSQIASTIIGMRR